MRNWHGRAWGIGLACLGALAAASPGQELASAQASGAAVLSEDAAARSASDGSIITRRDARTITQRIPAPRGLIVDRNGEPLAQNRVVYQVALQYRQFEKADRSFVVSWARTRIDSLVAAGLKVIARTDDELYDHYRHRRWLPLFVTGQLSESRVGKLGSKLMTGLALHPVYQRVYPQGETAAHILGYTGIVGKMPTGPINFNEPMWEESEGRAGLEKIYNAGLAGEPGMKKLLFDENGNKLLEEQVRRPRAGGTVVTTLDLEWQRLAERTLRGGCRRGAFVVIDVVTGEVLVMASRPSFDPNRFIPMILEDDFRELSDDPSTPLYGRAFQSAYPPASSYKPVVALAALDAGAVTENSTIYCPASIRIGRTVFNNHSKTPEGSINVKRAIARSCNTWFYKVGIDIGPSSFLALSRRLGFGERTGLPLLGETPGLVPTEEWMLRNEKRRFADGDTANLSIGQGALLASPLQVAQAMAGIANGGALPRLRLVRQVQDPLGRVVEAPIPEKKNALGVTEDAVRIVRKGMYDVINSPGGTGKQAGLSYTSICGKTGTAQWGPKAKNQRLAWFAGFLPRDNPRYAFAVLYEGRPGEKVSGGRMAAPMVRRFFQGIRKDIEETIAPPKKALAVDEEELMAEEEKDRQSERAQEVEEQRGEEEAGDEGEVPPIKALPVDEGTAEPPAAGAAGSEEELEVLDENVEGF